MDRSLRDTLRGYIQITCTLSSNTVSDLREALLEVWLSATRITKQNQYSRDSVLDERAAYATLSPASRKKLTGLLVIVWRSYLKKNGVKNDFLKDFTMQFRKLHLLFKVFSKEIFSQLIAPFRVFRHESTLNHPAAITRRQNRQEYCSSTSLNRETMYRNALAHLTAIFLPE